MAEKRYPARCIKCQKAFEVSRIHSAFIGVQTKYSCQECSESMQTKIELKKLKSEKDRAERQTKTDLAKLRVEEEGTRLERDKVQNETAKHQLELNKEKTRQQELELHKAEIMEREKTRQLELELQKAEILQKEKTKQHELDEKKAHWEQMRADIQSKVSTEQLKMKTTLAEAQKKQAESAQQAIQEFRKLKDDGVGVGNRDLTLLLHSIPQPRGYEQEHIPGRRPKIWTAPVMALSEQDESSDQ